ncbi:MAG TPA: GNAT family N-acetyltransferase [bacterium]|nr:GNAT family N-acetyltransferase [bacterium]
MSVSEILALYDAQMRAAPPPEAGVRYEHDGTVVRAIGTQNCIVFSDLAGANVAAVIAAQAAFFRSIGAEVEWKVYGHDLPADLGRQLAAAGFAPGDRETLMAFDLAARTLRGAAPTGVEIRRVTDAAGLADLVAVSSVAFGRNDGWKMEAFGPRLTDASLGLYVAYAGGGPVSAARVELPPGRSFAGLWGGGTVPAYRGRGIYRALVAVRAEEARRRGYRYLTVDARDGTSRPILEKLGFAALTSITGWTLGTAPSPAPV